MGARDSCRGLSRCCELGVGDEAEVANSEWAPVLRSVLDLARSSMPTMDHVKSVNAYTMLSPNEIQEGEMGGLSLSVIWSPEGHLHGNCSKV